MTTNISDTGYAPDCAQVIFEAFFGDNPPNTHYTADFSDPHTVDGKILPRYESKKRQPTIEDVRAHLRGKLGLLAVPVDESGMCRFGKIDIDDYSIDLVALPKQVRDFGLPLTPERSKSGGVHLAFYLPRPAPAKAVRALLAEWAERLGYPKAEIFPKQDALDGDGSGINLPYYGGDAAANHALGVNGERVPLDQWAEGLKVISDHPPMIAARLIAPHWVDDKRQGLGFALGGFLLRHGVAEETVGHLLQDVINKTGEEPKKFRNVTSIKRALDGGKHVPGFPTVCKHMGEPTAAILAACFAIDPENRSAGDDAEDPAQALASMNAKHAVVSWKGKTLVITERLDPVFERPTFDLSSFNDVTNWYSNQFVRGKKMKINKGAWWLKHPARRQYGSVAFHPGRELTDTYNLWQGWGVGPREGDCSAYLNMVRDVICSGNEEHYRFVIAWMADAVQNPMNRPGVVLVLRGLEGTGKGTMAREFGRLFGSSFLHIQNAVHLVGRFNSHLANTQLLFADEAFFAGDKQHEGVLKALVTEPTFPIEYKGRDVLYVRNFLRIIMASNKEWVVPASLSDRRFCVLDVSREHARDVAYFQAVADQMSAGGAAALFHYLLHYDRSGIDLRDIPDTAARREQQLRSMEPIPAFWHARLNNGAQLDTLDHWAEELATQELFEAYANEAGVTGERRRSHQTTFGIELLKMCPGVKKRSVHRGKGEHQRRVKVYLFPPLEECRRAFEIHVNREKINWDEATGQVRWKDFDDQEDGDF